ncbi:MAG: prolyl oligopeptidase family serine peptidase [Chloroflexota bacterium]|nr:prolyl oligopeptidase family serine peptidase [Chloroflexota bacterium]
MKPEEYLNALLALPGMTIPLVSRDRRWVAWTWFRTGPAADVFAAPTDALGAPIRLSDTAENIFLVSWCPDNKSIIVAQDSGGNERYQLSRIEVDRPLVLNHLTEPDPNCFIRGGDLHLNGRWLIYGANFDAETREEIEPTWIYRHDLQSGERKVLARPEKGAYIRPVLSPDGSHVLYSRKDRLPAGQQVWLVDIEGREDNEILNFGDDIKTNASWFPDSERVLVLSETATHRRVGVWHLTEDSIKWLVDNPDRNIENAYVPFGSDQIVILEVEGARTRASLLNPRDGDERQLTFDDGNLLPLAPYSENVWIGQYFSSRQPGDVIRFSVSDLAPEKSTSISRIWDRTPLSPEDFTQAVDHRWTSVDGLEIQGWLYRPVTKPKGCIVFVHGGPTWHSQDAINNQIQLFTRFGFVVLDPNYRGSTGFGLTFQEAIKKDGWGGLEQEDIRTGIEALIADEIAEPGKVGITGTSYGGYSAWCAITQYPIDVIACSTPVCGVTDLVVDYESTRPDLRPYIEEMMGGSPEQVPEIYFERSPINHIGNIQGQLMIVQGGRDPNVTPENVRVVRDALDQAGVPYQILVFEDEGHGISRPTNQKVLYMKLLEFFSNAFTSG